MIAQASQDIAKNAERIYEQTLKERLEKTHLDEFVAIEPISGDYFLGRTMSEAIGLARKAHPDRLVHAIRIGHEAALHFGVSLR